MRRFTKAIAAAVLGLILSLSLFTSGAFAQTVNATSATHMVVAQEASLAEQAASTYSNGYNDHSGFKRGPDHKWRIRCVRVPVWVRTRHGFRRVWARYCRRY